MKILPQQIIAKNYVAIETAGQGLYGEKWILRQLYTANEVKAEFFAERYLLLEELGSGSFGVVFKTLDALTGEIIALKIAHQGLSKKDKDDFDDEYLKVKGVRSWNLLVATHYGVYNGNPYLEMPLCTKSLSQLISETYHRDGKATRKMGSSNRLPEETVRKVLLDIATGLADLHRYKIQHCDLKPDNVLLDSDGNWVITDFGISTRLRATMTAKSKRSTPTTGAYAYASPEMLKRQFEASFPTDIFSFGVTLYELCEGYLPKMGEYGYTLKPTDEPLELSDKAYAQVFGPLMQKCLLFDPQQRPQAEQIVKWLSTPKTTYKATQEDVSNAQATAYSYDTIKVTNDTPRDFKNESKKGTTSAEKPAWKVAGIWLLSISFLMLVVFIISKKFNSDKTDNTVTVDEDAHEIYADSIASITIIDSDGDGVADSEDACPNEKGAAVNKGCPVKNPDKFTLTGLIDGDGEKYTYTGQVKNGKPHGTGSAKYENGDKFYGSYSDGNMVYGTYTFSDGNKYTGSFYEDKFSGDGTFYYRDGDIYTGNWERGYKHGTGTYTLSGTEFNISNCPECVKYVGEFIDGEKHGRGKCFDIDGNLLYEGRFKYDKPTGTYPSQ